MGKLSRLIEPVVMLAIKQHPGTHGYDLISRVQDLAMTDSEIEPGAVYRMLRQLEDAEMVESQWDTSKPGPARRRYTLTKDGDEHLGEWSQLITHRREEMDRFLSEFYATAKKSRS